MKPKIVVIGSINMDLITVAERIPQQGETVRGSSFLTKPGGKGANQAVAASKLGADVCFIGCVGKDLFGTESRENLEHHGIKTNNMDNITNCMTGIANVFLTDHDNRIIVVPGANDEVSPSMIRKYEDEIKDADFLLLQLEIPIVSVEVAADLAKKHGTKTILNPAPIQRLSASLLTNVDYITPNETEYEELVTQIDPQLIQDKVIRTKGEKGVSFFKNGEEVFVPAFPVEVIDTTGAGDTFIGALSVAMAERKTIYQACVFANAAAALAITKLGAQEGMPKRDEAEVFLSDNNQADEQKFI
ncbi:ribokinase [Alkalicoccus halolimnae]|uniref:Ribokinase n=1 Tax=Alkalicoccus halolimnae TaxID=1667239 RepID=A0A5C7FIJ8_9BACI|nr:ribokinase [Alkalicoccus halolimnae]TXF85306.1 ribokinase [Alkalicoccus halolimnae]